MADDKGVAEGVADWLDRFLEDWVGPPLQWVGEKIGAAGAWVGRGLYAGLEWIWTNLDPFWDLCWELFMDMPIGFRWALFILICIGGISSG